MTPQLIGVPYDASSSFLRGSAAAPPLIRAALRSPAGNSLTERGADLSQLADAGDLEISEDPAAARAQIEAGIADVIAQGFTPISLGGDHSITYPIMRAIAKHHRSVTILHIDAHGDLYDDFEGDRFSHACPFARIIEEGLCDRLVQVGIRTLTPDQRAQIKRWGVDTIEMQHFAGDARPSTIGPVYRSPPSPKACPGRSNSATANPTCRRRASSSMR